MRLKLRVILNREDAMDQDLDREARSRIRNEQEGTRTWEIRYRQVMEEIRRRKGL